jgi:hypothetical protein
MLRQLIFGIDNYNLEQQKLISINKDKIIKSIVVYRKPIQEILKQSLNILSFGKFVENLEKSPYDKIYHLYMIINLEFDISLILEKNERINIKVLNYKDYHNLTDNIENIKIDLLDKKIKLMDLLNNTKDVMGKFYFQYDSRIYNCQNFILNILKSNNIYKQEYEKFIYQNPKYFFHNISYLGKFNKLITDLGAKIDLIKRGSGLPYNKINKIYYNGKKYKINKNQFNKKKKIIFENIQDDNYIIYVVYH